MAKSKGRIKKDRDRKSSGAHLKSHMIDNKKAKPFWDLWGNKVGPDTKSHKRYGLAVFPDSVWKPIDAKGQMTQPARLM